MNWKLIFQLSVFGLIMAFATISLIPEKIEPLFWLVIFIFCAYTIARICTEKYFFNGFMVSVINCVWITAVDLIFCADYMKNHADRSATAMHMPAAMNTHPREVILAIAPISAIVFGLILGLFAFIASKIVKKKKMQAV
jgi:hypothetical protein